MIRVLFFPVGKPPEVRHIVPSALGLKELIGNWVERVRVARGLDLYVDEEGLLNGAVPNVRIPGRPIQIVGPAVLCGDDGEDIDSLTDEQIAVGQTFERLQ